MPDSALPPPSRPIDWRDAFLALPAEAPPTDGWTAIAPCLPATTVAHRSRRPRTLRWAAAASIALAAAGLLLRTAPDRGAVEAPRAAVRSATPPVVATVGTQPTEAAAQMDSAAATVEAPSAAMRPRASGRIRTHGIRSTSPVLRVATARPARDATSPPVTVATVDASTPSLDDLRAESARLEALAALVRDDRVASGPAMVLAADAEDRVRLIDAALSRTDPGDASQLDLWMRRVAALRELAGVEGTNRWLAANGESLEGAIALVD